MQKNEYLWNKGFNSLQLSPDFYQRRLRSRLLGKEENVELRFLQRFLAFKKIKSDFHFLEKSILLSANTFKLKVG